MRIGEESDKESRIFFNSSEMDKVILVDSSSEFDSESVFAPDICNIHIPHALDVSTAPECITDVNNSSPLNITTTTIKVLDYPDFFNDLMDGATKDLQLKEIRLSKNWLSDSLC